jgi:hypothetical protein
MAKFYAKKIKIELFLAYGHTGSGKTYTMEVGNIFR